MANNKTSKQVHVSPGIYFSESELSVASQSLGITKLGVVGETVKGPAFQPIEISNWAQFTSYFGGTSTEKFKGSQYPKYELPYIAKTYLEESQDLKVCRVLGLSGTNAGPAWVITVYGEKEGENDKTEYQYTKAKPMVVAVLRSRGEHKKAAFVQSKEEADTCEDVYEFDKLLYYAKEVTIERTNRLVLQDGCTKDYTTEPIDINITANNYGTFVLKVKTYLDEEKNYSVSLNSNDKNYIYNVIGGDPEKGDAEIYVEELYDVALRQLVESGQINRLTVPDNGTELTKFDVANIIPSLSDVNDFLTEDESMLRRSDVGKRYLYSSALSKDNENGTPLKVHVKSKNGVWNEVEGTNAHIYTVVAYNDTDGTRHYYYGEYEGAEESIPEDKGLTETDRVFDTCVYVKNDGLYYYFDGDEIRPITLDFNNYKEQYRYSTTPWIVSEIKGSAEHIELNKLFRFHTISDGSNSQYEVKISIENIEPDLGTFDVIIRDYFDSDSNPIILERYKGVNLVPSSQNYIALKIGSFDETYETQSRYVTVEVNENDITRISTPAGFLGYPVRDYTGEAVPSSFNYADNIEQLQMPYIRYNTNVDTDIRIKKQYFGMSDIVGIDDDVLKYKGVEAYNDIPSGLTPSFHLDARILNGKPDENGIVTNGNIEQTVSVDGIVGYEWVTVGKGNTLNDFGIEPRIGTEVEMTNTIYEDKRYRKFTLCFYGGFDGWDYYRTSRSNTEDFKYQRYRGNINLNSGEGTSFSVLRDVEAYGFDKSTKAINSDYYAYLSAIRQFANPKEIDINVFATPGIDYVNNNSLVGEVIEMIEEERADSIYVITTPDKPFGYGDNKSDMYTAEEAVDNLIDSNIDTNWACTYYPWIKYYDAANSQYIYLPPTKDVVKNFAYTDNTAAPWYAAAGWQRGQSDGIRSKKNLVLAEQDELYDGRINFVNNFADEGIRIWGDNNLQVEQSNAHMNKISKRRCLIRLRKLISIACVGLLFDPNDATTVTSFRSAVQPILEDFISKRALTDAKLVIDDSAEALDRLELNAQIYLKFQPNLEYIKIGLVATPNGVSFDDI